MDLSQVNTSSWIAIFAGGLGLISAMAAVVLRIRDDRKARVSHDNIEAPGNSNISAYLEAEKTISLSIKQLELLSKYDEYLSNAQENLTIAKENIAKRLDEITNTSN